MRRLATLLAATLLAFGLAAPAAADADADALMQALRANRQTRGLRLRMQCRQSVAGVQRRWSLRLLSRRSAAGQTLLVQATAPQAIRGQARRVDWTAGGAISVTAYARDGAAQSLTEAALWQPLWGEGLALADLAGVYWDWPLRRAAEQASVAGRACRYVELRAAPDSPRRVRACISAETGLPLRTEILEAAPTPARVITLSQLLRHDDRRWGARALEVRSADGGWRSSIEVLSAEPDLDLSDAELLPR